LWLLLGYGVKWPESLRFVLSRGGHEEIREAEQHSHVVLQILDHAHGRSMSTYHDAYNHHFVYFQTRFIWSGKRLQLLLAEKRNDDDDDERASSSGPPASVTKASVASRKRKRPAAANELGAAPLAAAPLVAKTLNLGKGKPYLLLADRSAAQKHVERMLENSPAVNWPRRASEVTPFLNQILASAQCSMDLKMNSYNLKSFARKVIWSLPEDVRKEWLRDAPLSAVRMYMPDEEDHLRHVPQSLSGAEFERQFGYDFTYAACWACFCGMLAPDEVAALEAAPHAQILDEDRRRSIVDEGDLVAPTPVSIARALRNKGPQ